MRKKKRKDQQQTPSNLYFRKVTISVLVIRGFPFPAITDSFS